MSEQFRGGTPAHQLLVAAAKSSRTDLVRLLSESSRDFEVLRDLLEQYVSYQWAADKVSGQS